MPLFETKSQSVSNWAAVARAGNAQPAPAASASGLATLLQQGAAERQSRSELSLFDVEFFNFSADTFRFINVTEGNLHTGLRHRTFSVGKLLYSFGATREEFVFADPVNDVQYIKKGIINRLRPVTEAEVWQMLSAAGVFDFGNKTTYRPLSERYDFIMKEGIGGGQLDFAGMTSGHMKLIGKQVWDFVNERDITPILFLIEGVAHNWSNCGNFLFGAAGEALGIKLDELLLGAHYNSIANAEDNDYPAQLDSTDDQFSIRCGYEYADKHRYQSRINRKWGLPRKSLSHGAKP